MLKTFLVYNIIDICFNILCSQIMRNFTIGIYDISDHQIGDHMTLRLLFGDRQIVLHNCVVKEKKYPLMTIISYDFEDEIVFILRDGIPISISGKGTSSLYDFI